MRHSPIILCAEEQRPLWNLRFINNSYVMLCYVIYLKMSHYLAKGRENYHVIHVLQYLTFDDLLQKGFCQG